MKTILSLIAPDIFCRSILLEKMEIVTLTRAFRGLSIERTIAPEPTTNIALNVKLPESATVIGTAGDTAIDPNDPSTFNQSQIMTLYDDAGESYTAYSSITKRLATTLLMEQILKTSGEQQSTLEMPAHPLTH
jgi:hypothetical protein